MSKVPDRECDFCHVRGAEKRPHYGNFFTYRKRVFHKHGKYWFCDSCHKSYHSVTNWMGISRCSKCGKETKGIQEGGRLASGVWSGTYTYLCKICVDIRELEDRTRRIRENMRAEEEEYLRRRRQAQENEMADLRRADEIIRAADRLIQETEAERSQLEGELNLWEGDINNLQGIEVD